MRRTSQSFLILALSTLACGPKTPDEQTTETGSTGPEPGSTGSSTDAPTGGPTTATTSTTDPTSDATTDATSDTTTGPPGDPSSGLDILFVIDNSGSMAVKQARLAAGVDALVAALGDRDVRIGITTTDNGNPRCPDATYTPERGAMSNTSCIDAVTAGEFQFNMEDFAFACTDVCDQPALTITPTNSAADGLTKPRPWLERIGGVINVEGDVSLAQALRCTLPRGVAGCGFESPLAAMRAALTRARDPSAPEFGFLRPRADLVVVFFTDEMDCGPTALGEEIFTTNKVYWNDPSDPAPTSGLCWRAGVHCEGAGPTYDSCVAANKDLVDMVTADPAMAVLEPVALFADTLAELQAGKQDGATVRLAAIAGVPVGFEDHLAELVFEDSFDPDFQSSFGIGPGCELPDPNGDVPARAVPPLRMLDLAQTLGEPRFHSICQDDFSAALADIAAGP